MKETINIKTFIALVIGFIGVVLIIEPFGIEISMAHILGVLGGFFAAAAYATIKKIKDIYDARIVTKNGDVLFKITASPRGILAIV